MTDSISYPDWFDYLSRTRPPEWFMSSSKS
jgi:hypothetical protein